MSLSHDSKDVFRNVMDDALSCLCGCSHHGATCHGYWHGRCVETLKISSLDHEAYPQMSPLVLGAVIMTQANSLRKVTLILGDADFTGTDSAILVSPQRHTVGPSSTVAMTRSDV